MRVCCFYTDLHPKTAAALAKHAPGTECIHVPRQDIYAYGRGLRARWTGRSDLVVIEHDNEIDAHVLASFTNCAHDWCTFGYQSSNAVPHYINMGLGCARFTAALQREVPFSAFEGRDLDIWPRCPLCRGAGGLCWRTMDARIGDALWSRAHVLCDHGEIPHHHSALQIPEHLRRGNIGATVRLHRGDDQPH